jgi:hypothetical protein
MKSKDLVNEDEIKFLERTLHKERIVQNDVKKKLLGSNKTFEKYFQQAKEFIEKN